MSLFGVSWSVELGVLGVELVGCPWSVLGVGCPWSGSVGVKNIFNHASNFVYILLNYI